MRRILILVLCFILVMTSTTIVFSDESIHKGNWSIAGNEEYSNKTITASQLTVNQSASLILKNCTLIFDGTGGLEVLEGGKLVLENCTLQGKDDSNQYFISIEGDNCIIDGCNISGAENPQKSHDNTSFSVTDCEGFELKNSEITGDIYLVGVKNSKIIANKFNGICTTTEELRNLPEEPAIYLNNSNNNFIAENILSAYATGINLSYSWENNIESNTWYGVEEDVITDSEKVWTVPITYENMAGTGIWLNCMSNNNVVSGNKMYGTSCTGFRITQSSNNFFEKNIVKGVRVGAVVNFASNNILNENEFYDIWEYEAVQMYRSYDNDIVNNLIDSANVGIGLQSSKDTRISGNKITNSGRGVFIYDSKDSTVSNNQLENCINNFTVDYSAGNKITGNNLLTAKDHSYSCGDNEWFNNFWEGETSSIDSVIDKAPSLTRNVIKAEAPKLKKMDFQPKQENIVFIDKDTIWENKTITIEGTIIVAQDVSLTLKNVKLIYAPSTYSVDHIPFGVYGNLTIEDSEVIGCEYDKQFVLVVENSDKVVIKNSSFQYMGEWGAAIGLNNVKSCDIENNVFKDSYASVVWDKCENVTFEGNTIENCNHGLEAKYVSSKTKISNNEFSRYTYQAVILSWNNNVTLEKNVFVDGWGSAIFGSIWFDYSMLYEKLSKNSFVNLKAPAYLSTWQYHGDMRGIRELSNSKVDVKKGEEIKLYVYTNGIHIKKELFGKPLFTNIQLLVNGKVIDQKDADITGGKINNIELNGIAPEDGIYEVRIGSEKVEFQPAIIEKPVENEVAKRSEVKVMINGKAVSFDVYNIKGNNYFKLRDLAMALNGSEKQFQVIWNQQEQAINLIKGSSYTTVGGELKVSKGDYEVNAAASTSKVLLDGKAIKLTAYNIGGNNYFRLRDIGNAMNFGIEWDGNTSTIIIDTSKDYVE